MTGKEIKEGDKIISFRGEEFIFINIASTKNTGKLYVKRDEKPGGGQELYTHVFPDLEIK